MTKKDGKMIAGSASADPYLQLIQKFPPRTITSEVDLDRTQVVIDSMLDRPRLSSHERDYLNVLSALVHEYEETNAPIPDLHGAELVKVLLKDLGLRQKDLLPIFKTESIISDVLKGKRKLTVGHIQGLANFFHVSPAVFFPTSS